MFLCGTGAAVKGKRAGGRAHGCPYNMPPHVSDLQDTPERPPRPPEEIGGTYARYVLGVLVVVYVFNFVDRQILSILAEHIKKDLGITDAQLGFLYGTAFA